MIAGRTHRRLLGAALATILFTGCATRPSAPAAMPEPLTYMIGADLSFLRQVEARGKKFFDEGVGKPGLQLFRDHGYSWIRLRLFHTPTRLPNDLGYTIETARQAKLLGYKFLLDLHYSDTWADPGKQFVPKTWEGKSPADLEELVFDYTQTTLKSFAAAGVLPDMVQIGNEVSNGMLWPSGRLPENWGNFASYLKAGIRGVESAVVSGARPRVMIHYAQGADREKCPAFFARLRDFGVEFDVIGLSYYPWWHGTLLELRENLAGLAKIHGKDIVLVEVAYNWRPTEYRTQPAPFPETPAGQREFLEQVNSLILAVPEGRGKGVFWWEPAAEGRILSRSMFDEAGNALPVLKVFDRFTRGRVSKADQ